MGGGRGLIYQATQTFSSRPFKTLYVFVCYAQELHPVCDSFVFHILLPAPSLPPSLLQMVLGRGAMVDVLVQSDVARYLEFQAVKRLLSPRQGKMEPVPCSRADLFSTKEVSMPEKRKMMKFLTFCAEFEKHPEEYEGEWRHGGGRGTGREEGWEKDGGRMEKGKVKREKGR